MTFLNIGGQQGQRWTHALLSVVIPVHNEAANLDPLLERLRLVLEAVGLAYEIVIIDDGSGDDTVARVRALSQHDPRIKLVSFSRNFGKEVALAAGLRYARGDAVVLMDGDLQHPPELIATFVERWRQGYQMVYGQRTQPSSTSPGRVLATRLFYRVFTALAQTKLTRGACDFRLIDRRAVDALNALTEHTRFTKGLYAWVGFKQIGVPFDPAPRCAGRSGWSNIGLVRFALDAITSFSTTPLRVWAYLGAGMTGLAVLGLAAALLTGLGFDAGAAVVWYLPMLMALFAGLQLLGLGVIGEYLGRVFNEVRGRPLFLVAEEIGFDKDDSHADEPAARQERGYRGPPRRLRAGGAEGPPTVYQPHDPQ
jgi:glycosyltransferase involved in cell wall biosynthesis